MNLSFTNGTSDQTGPWKAALLRLMNLPGSVMPLQISVTFVDPSEVTGDGHKDLASTTWTYGSVKSTVKVRNDAPNFGGQQKSLEAEAASQGLSYNPARFYGEVAGHELGHSAFASLPEEQRVAIAKMFGAKSDDLGELAPEGSEWADRIIEGIAETFKEAFVPRKFRVFGNRTNRRISYSEYPNFRSHFRAGIEASSGEGTLVPAYDLDVYRVNGLEVNTSYFKDEAAEFAFLFFFKNLTGLGKQGTGLLDYSVGDWGPLEANDNTLYRRYLAESATEILMVPPGTNFKGSVDLPYDNSYFAPSSDWGPVHGPVHNGDAGFFGTFTEAELIANPEFAGPLGPFGGPPPSNILGSIHVSILFAYYEPAKNRWITWDRINGGISGFTPIFFNPHPNFPTNCWLILKEGASAVFNQGESWSIPPGTLSLDADVPEGVPTIETCGGDMARVRIVASVSFRASLSRQDSIETIQSRLPSFTLHTPAGPCKGEPIEVPRGVITPGDSRLGVVPSRHHVVGR